MLTRRAKREVRQALKHIALGAFMGAIISAALFGPMLLN